MTGPAPHQAALQTSSAGPPRRRAKPKPAPEEPEPEPVPGWAREEQRESPRRQKGAPSPETTAKPALDQSAPVPTRSSSGEAALGEIRAQVAPCFLWKMVT